MARIEIAHRQTAMPPPPVRINGVEIDRDAIGKEAQHHPADTVAEARLAATRALAIRELLLQEARRLGIEPVPATDAEGRRETDEEAVIRILLEREVVTPAPDDATLRRYFENNRARFRTPDLFAPAHILIAADPADAQARDNARAEAKALALLLAETGRVDEFEAAARAVSACPSASQGGALGQIGPGQTVPEFEAALSRMAEGVVHPEPVETRYGFHIVRLDRRIDGQALPFEIVRERIAEYLAESAMRVAMGQYVRVLAGRARVEGIDLEGAAGPLLQ